MWEASSLSRAIAYPNGSRCWPQVEGAWPRQGSGDNCFHSTLLRGVGGKRAAEFTNYAAQLEGTGEALTGHKTFCECHSAVGSGKLDLHHRVTLLHLFICHCGVQLSLAGIFCAQGCPTTPCIERR